jgi:hypothetical protein
MVLLQQDRERKLRNLHEINEFVTVGELIEACVHDNVNYSIYVREGRDYSTEVEPDRKEGRREECGTRIVRAALVLAEVVW